jgi:UDP:flavonoid glycosyltransferase YjiC (YdhE family)
LDTSLVAEQCDLAILNAGHGTTAAMLMAGKPVLQLPIHLEQTLNAAATVRLGAGLSAAINRPEEIAVKLMALLCSDIHTEAARRFAERCVGLDPGRQVRNALQRIEALVA